MCPISFAFWWHFQKFTFKVLVVCDAWKANSTSPSQTSRVSVCWHCSIMFLFTMWKALTDGGGSFTLHMSLQLSTANGQWGGGCSSSTLHMSLQLLTANGQWGAFTSHMPLQLSTADGQWGWILLHITHITSTLNCWWPMGMGGTSSTLHMSLQLLTADGQWGILHITHVTSTLNCWWPLGVGGTSSIQHMSLQLSTANGQWGWVFLLHIAHVTSTLNCQWPMGGLHITHHFNSQLLMANEGGSSSTSHISLQLSTADGQLGWVGHPPHCTCHFNS